ncbi:MAG: M20/M25/M40 family metallo-hydrolase, partial [Bacteroidia bacterium]|nr:M20/M25/M40 family metallo-hydrolase [Bacteroidia bacterium]
MIKNNLTLFSFILFAGNIFCQKEDSLMIKKISDYYLSQSNCYKNLVELTTKVGGRLAGSPEAAKAVKWAEKVMKESGADTVYLQQCKVPHWVRGAKEQCKATSKKLNKNVSLDICALGFSIATPAAGLKAKVIEVKSFEELEAFGEEKIKGKIVYYNVAFNPTNIKTGTSYGETVKYRWGGSSKASKFGAVGVIVRSMSSVHDDVPHTGVMRLDTNGRQIPACAVSLIDGDMLSEMLKQDANVEVTIKMNCKLLPDEISYNVIGEIKGSEFPDEIIVSGGHLDSWETGTGAHDDGAGVVHTIEMLRAFKQIGYKPKRTIRVVAFMNEENGGRGGDAYAEASLKNKTKHIAALESDAGGFTPRTFGLTATSPAIFNKVKAWQPLLFPLGIMAIHEGGGGADIGDLKAQGANLFGFEPDSQRYFDIHHTPNDKIENVNKRELELGAACIGSLI